MPNATNILTPVGRLVGGSPFDPQTLDAEGRPLVIKSGPNAGQPRVSYFMALAIPKTDPGIAALVGAITSTARAAFPQYFDAAGNCTLPKFAFKFEDGDSTVPNAKGNRPCDREGYPGCYVFKFSNGFAPKCYTKGGAAIIIDPTALKCGYYVRIYANVAGNESLQQPGIFLNCSMVELVGYGEEISFGPSGDQVFGATPAALPPQASAMPIAPRVPLAAPAPAAPAYPPAAPAYPPVQPARDFLTPPMPPAPPMPPTVPPPTVDVSLDMFIAPNGARVSRGALLAAGWTNAQVIGLPRG